MLNSIFKSCISIILICSFNYFCSIQSLSTENLRYKPATDKLTLAEWPSYNIQNPNGPGTYAYGYEIDDPASKNVQFRDEEKLANGTVQGSYGIVRTDGMVTLTRYISDIGGYRAKTQSFNRNDVQATILTTESPKISQMPNGIGYLDLETIPKDVIQPILDPNTIPEDVAQQILAEQNDINPSDIIHLPTVTAPTLLDRIDNDDNDDDTDNYGDDEHEDPDPITNENYQNLQAILSGHNPITITTTKDNKNNTVGVQFINNYIPHNFQLIPFFLPKRSKQNKPNNIPENMNFHDPIDEDTKPFVNDKFHDPSLDDFRNNQNKFGKWKFLNQPTKRQDTKLKNLKNYKLNNKQRRNINKNNRYRIIFV